MIGLSFSLTPHQTKLLVEMAYGHYTYADKPASAMYPKLPVSASGHPHFLSSMNALKRKGLVDHQSGRDKSYRPTEEGMSVAALVVKAARELAELADNVSEMKEGEAAS